MKEGKIVHSVIKIGEESNGTDVFEGAYEGRKVAVKRIRKDHRDVANKEIQMLKNSDQHPNIVRLYGTEDDGEFIYIALERCECSLHDLILSCVQFNWTQFNPTQDGFTHLTLWNPNWYPSEDLLKFMRLDHVLFFR